MRRETNVARIKGWRPAGKADTREGDHPLASKTNQEMPSFQGGKKNRDADKLHVSREPGHG